MSTLAEIQEAVGKLPQNEKTALSLWLDSQITPEISAQEEQELLHSLNEAIREIDSGRGVPMQDVHKLVKSWVAK
jgi:hypothetical protein